MGPWCHGIGRPTGDVNFVAAHSASHGLAFEWTQHWLKGRRQDIETWPVMRFFAMGAGKWVDSETWPPKQSSPTRFYLTKGGFSEDPPGQPEEPSTFVYHPVSPVLTRAGNNLVIPSGIHDHQGNASRADVVTFVSESLGEDLAVAGRLSVHLFVSSSAPDTDFTAMLLDIRPDGYAANVQDGIARVRYRDGRDKPKLLKPNEIVEIDIDLWSTAYMFKKGHRAALYLSSSNFPRFDRNLNTADPPGRGLRMQKAENKVYHDPAHPSYVVLPLVKR